jgi:hypothetical protein
LAFQRERVFDDGPHRANAVRRCDCEPEVEIDFVHLVEGVSDAARPLRAASSCAAGCVIHGGRIAEGVRLGCRQRNRGPGLNIGRLSASSRICDTQASGVRTIITTTLTLRGGSVTGEEIIDTTNPIVPLQCDYAFTMTKSGQ